MMRGWFGLFPLGLCMLVFWGGVIVLGVFAFRALLRQQPQQGSGSPEEVLKMRLAKGEITKEQFEELKGLVKK